MNTFFETVLRYFDERGWEPPGTQEQFREAIEACWDAKVISSDDGSQLVQLPVSAYFALVFPAQSAN